MPLNTAHFISSRLIAYYRNRVQEQKLHLNVIRKALPSALAVHVRHCVTDNNKLLLYTDSAAWASLLRFYKAEILTAINTAPESKCDSVQIRILKPIANHGAVVQQKTNFPSAENLMLLRRQSENISDTELKLSLKKLCETLALKFDR